MAHPPCSGEPYAATATSIRQIGCYPNTAINISTHICQPVPALTPPPHPCRLARCSNVPRTTTYSVQPYSACPPDGVTFSVGCTWQKQHQRCKPRSHLRRHVAAVLAYSRALGVEEAQQLFEAYSARWGSSSSSTGGGGSGWSSGSGSS